MPKEEAIEAVRNFLLTMHEDELMPGQTSERLIVFDDTSEFVMEAACYLEGHYEAGMTTLIRVLDT